MTFILNVLHKDFSLLASDIKATAKGPTTIKMPGITIHAEKGAMIHGYKKIYLSKSGNIAVGFAGTTGDHSYISKVEESEGVDSTLSLIRGHMEGFLNIQDHKAVLELSSFMENQGITTYYEPETKEFFSNIYIFSPIHNYTRLYSSPPETGHFIHVGSGSSVFESAVGLEEITQFAGSLKSISDIPACIEWIKQAYKKVSAIDKGSGEEVVAFLATKEEPVFVEKTSSNNGVNQTANSSVVF